MGDEKRETFAPLSGDRIAVLAERGRRIGAPATHDEERAMALEIREARARIRELEAERDQMWGGYPDAHSRLQDLVDSMGVVETLPVPRLLTLLEERLPNHCPVHDNERHGGEAEELRAMVEKAIDKIDGLDAADVDSITSIREHLESGLEDIDARDSVAFLERTRRRRESEAKPRPSPPSEGTSGPPHRDAAVVLREDFAPNVEAGRATMEKTMALLAARRRAATTCIACGHEGDLVRGLCRDMIACHSRELKQAAPGAWRKEK